MGGICGVVLRDKAYTVSGDQILRMTNGLMFSGNEQESTATMGHVAMGSQEFPGMLSGLAKSVIYGRTLTLCFYGSIYNTEEFSFGNKSPQAVLKALLDSYAKEGKEFFSSIRGNFASAIWDARDDTLYLTTDRFRVHTLFYYQDSEKFIFSSRMKGILACPLNVRRTVDPEAIVDFVGMSIIPGPKSIFREVKKVPPASILMYRDGRIKIDSYWHASFLTPSRAKESALANELRRSFSDAVGSCLKSEKDKDRIGSFLSGGIDSSTLAAVMTDLLKRPIKCFSIGFMEERFNEIRYARIAAQALKSEHFEYFVTPADTYNTIPLLMEVFDEPYGNASAVPTYFCAKLAREWGIRVLYGGDGGDEIFAGNKRYAIQHYFDYYGRIPPLLRESVLKPLVLTIAGLIPFSPVVKAKKYILRAGIPYYERITSYDFLKVVPMSEFFEHDFLKTLGRIYEPYEIFSTHYFNAPARTNLDRHLYIDWHLTISDNDILKFKMAEQAGVAVRFPFLDHKLVEFSVKVPAEIKMRRTKLRSFFKKAYSKIITQETIEKKKHGFGLPIPIWLLTDSQLNEIMRDLVLGSISVQRGYFKKRALEKLVEAHRTDTTNFYGTVLWHLMILELWHRRYCAVSNKNALCCR
jgi:asparagine synthase (glutamine-hydrolysing)